MSNSSLTTATTSANPIHIIDPWATNSIVMGDDQVISIGPDFSMPAKALKACLKTLLPLAMEEYPEDFV